MHRPPVGRIGAGRGQQHGEGLVIGASSVDLGHGQPGGGAVGGQGPQGAVDEGQATGVGAGAQADLDVESVVTGLPATSAAAALAQDRGQQARGEGAAHGERRHQRVDRGSRAAHVEDAAGATLVDRGRATGGRGARGRGAGCCGADSADGAGPLGEVSGGAGLGPFGAGDGTRGRRLARSGRWHRSRLQVHALHADRILGHHQLPARLDQPGQVQGPTVGLRAALVEGEDLVVAATVTQMAFGDVPQGVVMATDRWGDGVDLRAVGVGTDRCRGQLGGRGCCRRGFGRGGNGA